eukprot:CAMPEP_0202443056 /NCGR_PEP_ID=MMETSP1360-20130828/2415_1 /ASSEMBLY_ACC=CAM_ASM_000848 /TAXON_ID=515479 /ORGANISM="Licmophora paradoxa, Strain CCMP2313" /LENGTH=471 /DNA_ID=CAMNT_0049058635 /DNA_START=175 /DNA_END=1590 /DNA_ORIENTATION=+
MFVTEEPAHLSIDSAFGKRGHHYHHRHHHHHHHDLMASRRTATATATANATANATTSTATTTHTSDPSTTTVTPSDAAAAAAAAGSGWFSDIRSLAGSAKSMMDGMAHIIHRSAITVVEEISQLERDAAAAASAGEGRGTTTSTTQGAAAGTTTATTTATTTHNANSTRSGSGWKEDRFGNLQYDAVDEPLPLPWEIRRTTSSRISNKKKNSTTTPSSCDTIAEHDDNKDQEDYEDDDDDDDEYIEDEELRDRILDLSTDEKTFLGPFSCKNILTYKNKHNGTATTTTTTTTTTTGEFFLDEARIHLIRRLLETDGELAFMHARLSGRSDVKEAIFWRNYFYHCDAVRSEYLGLDIDDDDEDDDDDDDDDDDLSDLEDVDVASRSTVGSMVIAKKPTSMSAAGSASGNAGASTSSQHLIEDNGSFVCVRDGAESSAPNSVATITDTFSLGDLVLVGPNGGDIAEALESKNK